MKALIPAMGVLALLGFLALQSGLLDGGSWDRVEGITRLHVLAAQAGALHPPADPDGPLRLPLYGALWYRLVVLLPGDPLAAGRILSLASCLGLSLLGYVLLRRRFGAGRGPALLGSLAWLGWIPALQFGATLRCDAPALLVGAYGWSLGLSSRPRLVALGGGLAALSGLLRPTAGVEALVWGCASLALVERSRLKAWLLGAFLGGMIALGTFTLLDGAAGWHALTLAGATPRSLPQALDLLLRLAPLSLPFLALATLAWTPGTLARAALASLLLASVLLLRSGANLNWMLGPSWLLSLGLAFAVPRVPSLLLALLALQTTAAQLPRMLELARTAHTQPGREALLQGLQGPVLTAEPLLLRHANTTSPIEDPHLVETLSRSGALPSGLLLDRLRRERWAVLTDPDLLSARPRHWSRATALWVRDSTRPCRTAGSHQLRLPKERPCPTSP